MKKYKYKLTEKPFKVGDKEVKDDVESTVTNVDPTTGSVTWDIKKLPSINNVFKKFKELSKSIRELDKDTEDNIIDSINDNVNKLFNQYRTHVRKKYPNLYKPKVDEISTSGGAGAYLSKASRPIKKKIKEEGDPKVEIWQQNRIDAFDKLEQRLTNLKKKLIQGKLATIKYYREHPTNWSVVYGTDTIADYFNDIETLLSNDE